MGELADRIRETTVGRGLARQINHHFASAEHLHDRLQGQQQLLPQAEHERVAPYLTRAQARWDNFLGLFESDRFGPESEITWGAYRVWMDTLTEMLTELGAWAWTERQR